MQPVLKWSEPGGSAAIRAFSLQLLSVYLVQPVLPIFVVKLGASPLGFGAAVGCMALASVVIRPGAGMIADRIGSRRVLLWGGLGLAAAPVLYGMSTTVPLLIGARALGGVALALAIVGSYSWVGSAVAEESRATAYSILASIAPTCLLVGSPAGLWIYERYGCWTTFGLSAFVGALGTAAIVRFRNAASRADARRDSSYLASAAEPLWSAISPAVVPGTVLCLASFGYSCMLTFIPLLSLERTLSASLVIAFFACGMIAGRMSTGWLLARMSRSRATEIGLMLFATGLLAMSWTEAPAAVLLLAATISGAGFGPLSPVLILDVLDRCGSHPGLAIALFTSSIDLGLAVAPFTLAWVMSRFGIESVFQWAGCACVMGLAFYLVFQGRRPRAWARADPAKQRSRRNVVDDEIV